MHPKLADIPSKVIFHGHYRSVYPNHLSRSECRQQLELPEHCTVLSFMGSIRPYKNVPHLLDQFSHIDSPDLKLLIAGSGKDETLLTEIRERASKDNRVRLDIGFVPAERLQVYLNASDLVVLPFQNILNSGSTLLALSFDRPVLVPDCGSLPELQSHLGEQWVKLYRGELTAQTIAEAVEWAKSISERPERHVDFRDYEWDQIAMNTAAFYYELLRI
ncbi:MAG: glycosyltransferase [Cyanobacteria bacterium P01_F01_bin.33]